MDRARFALQVYPPFEVLSALLGGQESTKPTAPVVDSATYCKKKCMCNCSSLYFVVSYRFSQGRRLFSAGTVRLIKSWQ